MTRVEVLRDLLMDRGTREEEVGLESKNRKGLSPHYDIRNSLKFIWKAQARAPPPKHKLLAEAAKSCSRIK